MQKYSEMLSKAINSGLKQTALPPQPPKVLLTGLPPKSSNPLQFTKKPPIAPPNFMKPPVLTPVQKPEPAKPPQVDVFELIPKVSEMDPEERADYFTRVDRLESEQIPENQTLDAFKIPTTL